MKIGIRGGEVVDFLIDVKDGVAYAESSGNSSYFGSRTYSENRGMLFISASNSSPSTIFLQRHSPTVFSYFSVCR